MVGDTRNPPTLIQRPLAKATNAREITNDGNSDVIKTTKDSAARRSRKSHMRYVKKAVASGLKFESQYEITENSREMTTTIC